MESWFAHTRVFRQYDWVLLACVAVLLAVSFASLYSIDLSQGETLTYFTTQAIAVALGATVMAVCGALHITWYRAVGRVTYLAAILLLVGVLLFGETIRGTTGWFRFGGFSFQPAEFAKVALIIILGMLTHRYGRDTRRLSFLISSMILTGLMAGLILIQPDLGSAAVLVAVWFGILSLTAIRKRYLVLLVGVFLLAAVGGWFFVLADYQKDRIHTFFDPAADPLGSGYNVTQSIIAIGAGQMFGRGLGSGSQSQLQFLPEAQTDFIFAVIAEELGFLGVCTVLLMYTILLWRLLLIARQADSDFAAAVSVGIALVFLVQLILNIGGAAGLLPITGVTLPFLSYGGSALIMNLLLIGIAESVAKSGTEEVVGVMS